MDRDWIERSLELLDDPYYGLLHAPLWRRCLELSLLACDHDQDGLLPPLADCAAHLHLSQKILKKTLQRLSKLGWMDETPQGWVVHYVQGGEQPARRIPRKRHTPAAQRNQKADGAPKQTFPYYD